MTVNTKTKTNFTLNTRRSVLTGLILIVGIMMASSDGIKGFFGTLFNYGNLSESYHEMMRTSHDPDIRFGNFSPDGTKVVLNYRPMVDNEEGISYIGILEIATGKIQLIRPPEEYEMWYDGSFSPDGKEMVFSFSKKNEKLGLAILDLSTMTHRIVVTSDTAKKNASFSPDGKRLIYVGITNDTYTDNNKIASGKSNDIFEYDLIQGKETRLTQLHYRSGGAAPRYFPDGEQYIFSAEYPYAFVPTFELANAHRKQYEENTTYIFNRNVMQIEAIPAIIHKDHSRFTDISQDGKKILCIARSHLHKTGAYNYDLFLYENGQIRQLTDLQWKIIDAALTPDGNQAVFVADTTPSRGSERKLYLYNIETNTTAPIELKPENITWLDAKYEDKK
ncbi:MAG: hypothetical protein A3K14_02430 [Sulfurimonas sp. RIFCSPLOWO2_12_FULL_36_74]|nr:MAG: hypothetical protein A3K14_02430 [Sulfurimonas sp. RIFCSPLOWO2_12_FULL_36_74]